MFTFVRNWISNVLVIFLRTWADLFSLFLQLCEVRPLSVADGDFIYFISVYVRRNGLVLDRHLLRQNLRWIRNLESLFGADAIFKVFEDITIQLIGIFSARWRTQPLEIDFTFWKPGKLRFVLNGISWHISSFGFNHLFTCEFWKIIITSSCAIQILTHRHLKSMDRSTIGNPFGTVVCTPWTIWNTSWHHVISRPRTFMHYITSRFHWRWSICLAQSIVHFFGLRSLFLVALSSVSLAEVVMSIVVLSFGFCFATCCCCGWWLSCTTTKW